MGPFRKTNAPHQTKHRAVTFTHNHHGSGNLPRFRWHIRSLRRWCAQRANRFLCAVERERHAAANRCENCARLALGFRVSTSACASMLCPCRFGHPRHVQTVHRTCKLCAPHTVQGQSTRDGVRGGATCPPPGNSLTSCIATVYQAFHKYSNMSRTESAIYRGVRLSWSWRCGPVARTENRTSALKNDTCCDSDLGFSPSRYAPGF